MSLTLIPEINNSNNNNFVGDDRPPPNFRRDNEVVDQQRQQQQQRRGVPPGGNNNNNISSSGTLSPKKNVTTTTNNNNNDSGKSLVSATLSASKNKEFLSPTTTTTTTSKQRDWIQKRWKFAFKSVASGIGGLKKFDNLMAPFVKQQQGATAGGGGEYRLQQQGGAPRADKKISGGDNRRRLSCSGDYFYSMDGGGGDNGDEDKAEGATAVSCDKSSQHDFCRLNFLKSKLQQKSSCQICNAAFASQPEDEYSDGGKNSPSAVQCQKCHLLAHLECTNLVDNYCHKETNHKSKFRNQIVTGTRSQETIVNLDEATNRYHCTSHQHKQQQQQQQQLQQNTTSIKKENLIIENSAEMQQQQQQQQQMLQQQRQQQQNNNNNNNKQQNKNNVDPIYLALKEGNKMASMRKQSLVLNENGVWSQSGGGGDYSAASTPTTPPIESAPSAIGGRPQVTEDTKLVLNVASSAAKSGQSSRTQQQQPPVVASGVNNNNNKSVAAVNKAAAAAASSSNKKGSSADVSSSTTTTTTTAAVRTRATSPKIGSAPNLLSDKVTDSTPTAEQPGSSRKIVANSAAAPVPAAQQKLIRKAPKLDLKMKSVSLDCAESTAFKKNTTNPTGALHVKSGGLFALAPNRHAYRVPPCKYNSFESDDTMQSSNSGSPCPSSICGSTLALPSNSYSVTHDYYAKFPDEIDLRVGERVLVVDTSDPDWWQGHNASGRLGIFPSTCLAHIHCNERTMQVVQNVCLWVGSKNTRLYRDQIVFAQIDEFVAENLITVRTERDHRVNCPLQYLMSLE